MGPALSQAFALLASIGVLAAFVILPPPEGLPPEAFRTGGVAVVMAGLWVTGVFDIAITALLPLVLFPALGIASIGQSAAPYADPLIFLMIGGSVLGHAMERVGLHERLVAALLAPSFFRRDARRVLLALMLAAGLVSAFVSNTATALMMLPLALLLAERSGSPRTAFGLGLAHAASIGGVATLVGTFPNAVFAKIASEQAGRTVDFGSWLLVGGPFAAVAVPLAWALLAWRFLPGGTAPIPRMAAPAWRVGERFVLGIWALAALLWTFRRPLDLGPVSIGGWADLLGLGARVDDAWVAMAVAALLLLVPAAGGRPVVTFESFERSMPWGVMLVLGGGFALAEQIEASGLSEWLAGPASSLGSLPGPVAVLVVCALVTALSELTSNTATTQLVLPLLVAGAGSAGVDPMVWMVPATISASCGFMMPISTPPMAIAGSGARVSARDMATSGLALDIALIGLAALVGVFVAPAVFVPQRP